MNDNLSIVTLFFLTILLVGLWAISENDKMEKDKVNKTKEDRTIKYPIVVEGIVVDSINHINVVDINNNSFTIENHSKIYSIGDTIK